MWSAGWANKSLDIQTERKRNRKSAKREDIAPDPKDLRGTEREPPNVGTNKKLNEIFL